MENTRTPLPAIVKRNTTHLVANQAVFAMVAQTAYILAPIVVYTLTSSLVLSGLAATVIYGGRAVIVFETGRLMDRIGRNTVLLAGVGIGSLSLFSMGWAVISGITGLFWLGLLLFGFGSGVLQQTRIPILDMYPRGRSGEGIGYLMTGNLVGSLLSPVFTAALIAVASSFLWNSYGTILLASALILAVSSVFIIRVKPDPREVARNISVYYPNEPLGSFSNDSMEHRSLIGTILLFPILVAFVTSALAWGDMNMVTSLISLVLHHEEVVLTLISLSVTLHTVGMFAFSVPFGSMCDKVGRKVTILLGGVLLAVGVFLTPITSNYAIITFAIFIAGLGWSATNVGTSVLISDLVPSERRGGLIGANDVATGLASLSLPAFGAIVIANLGLFSFGLAGLVVALPAVFVTLSLREIGKGHYTRQSIGIRTRRRAA